MNKDTENVIDVVQDKNGDYVVDEKSDNTVWEGDRYAVEIGQGVFEGVSGGRYVDCYDIVNKNTGIVEDQQMRLPYAIAIAMESEKFLNQIDEQEGSKLATNVIPGAPVIN